MLESLATITAVFILMTLFIALVDRQIRQEINKAMAEHLGLYHKSEQDVYFSNDRRDF